MSFKYVMLETGLSGVKKLVPVIFPDFMCHIDVAEAIKKVLVEQHKMPCSVVSAGDIQFEEVECSGESVTLKVGSRFESDTNVIERYPYFHGLEGLD